MNDNFYYTVICAIMTSFIDDVIYTYFTDYAVQLFFVCSYGFGEGAIGCPSKRKRS